MAQRTEAQVTITITNHTNGNVVTWPKSTGRDLRWIMDTLSTGPLLGQHVTVKVED